MEETDVDWLCWKSVCSVFLISVSRSKLGPSSEILGMFPIRSMGQKVEILMSWRKLCKIIGPLAGFLALILISE